MQKYCISADAPNGWCIQPETDSGMWDGKKETRRRYPYDYQRQ